MSESYRSAITGALADGWSFAGLHAAAGGRVIRAALMGPDGSIRLETVAAHEGRVPTIVDLAPAAGWDEREAADLYGIAFDGHEPLRPLVDHDLDLRHWAVPVRGGDAYQVAVGPVHAGVIESGHFRFHVVGDRILHLDARLFYKHRGLERIWNHLNDIAAICAGVGLAAGNNRFASLTEEARRLNARLTGHRFAFGAVQVGESRLGLDRDTLASARRELAEIAHAARSAWRELIFNASFNDRLPDVGIVTRDDALSFGATGPAARASGVRVDARERSTGLAYDGFTAVVPERAVGDVQARLEQRALELLQSFELLDSLLADPVVPAAAAPAGPGREIGTGHVESPRGATLCVVEQSHGRIERLHLRTGSYANWPVLAAAAAGNLLPDFPLINKSFELCYACADR